MAMENREVTAGMVLRTLGLLREFDTFDAMRLSIQYRARFKVRIDWHEFSWILDILCNQGWIEVSGHGYDRMTQYRKVVS